jgi:hypothetical protein
MKRKCNAEALLCMDCVTQNGECIGNDAQNDWRFFSKHFCKVYVFRGDIKSFKGYIKYIERKETGMDALTQIAETENQADTESRKYAYYLLSQADANETYAALTGGRKAKKLNKVAFDMRKEAIAIMDKLTGYDPSEDAEDISDEDLLKELRF